MLKSKRSTYFRVSKLYIERKKVEENSLLNIEQKDYISV